MANTSSNAVDEHPGVTIIVPELYVKSHSPQRALGIRTLDLMQMLFGSRPSKSQQFIDLGCGTGDFTRQELLPRCQPCRRIVATDISAKMVEYARDKYAHPQIEYEVHDVQSDVTGLVSKYGKFDRVYSFFALHWAMDLTAVIRNVSDLMTDDGECLLLFPARAAINRVWKRIGEMDRWKEYKDVFDSFTPPTQDFEDRMAMFGFAVAFSERRRK